MSISEKRTHRFFLYLGYFVAFAIASHALYSSYLEFMPTKHWYNYYDIQPVSTEFIIGEPLVFAVDFEIKRKSDMVYHDSIMCKINGDEEFVKVFSRTSENPGHEVTPRTKKHFSMYFSPNKEMECCLESHIVAEKKFGIKKIQDVNPCYAFKFVREKDATTSTAEPTVPGEIPN